jgi:hypothetical protein
MTPNPADGHRDPSEIPGRTTFRRDNASQSRNRFICRAPGGPAAHTFQAIRENYRWAGATLVLVSRQTTTIRGAPADPALAGYRGVSCGNLPQYEPVR